MDDIDLFVGGSLEQPKEGAVFGPVFKCIVGDTFLRIISGDRYSMAIFDNC